MGNGRTMSVAFEPLVVGLFEQAVPVPGGVVVRLGAGGDSRPAAA